MKWLNAILEPLWTAAICVYDSDEDGVCDDIDDCIGVIDVCGVCNGACPVYDCGCTDIPEGDCDAMETNRGCPRRVRWRL